MITDIPSPSAFYDVSLGHLNLAWSIGMELQRELLEAEYYNEEFDNETLNEYWAKSQPMLANAYALVQQAQEYGLKGKISSVSPYLLLTRDPRDWPRKSETEDVPFSSFRMADAADLVRIHNVVADTRLPSDFSEFYNDVRRLRNVIVHQGRVSQRIPVVELFANVIRTHDYLFRKGEWPKIRRDHLDNDRISALHSNDHAGAVVVQEFDALIDLLTPSQAIALLGFDKKARRYLCPYCNDEAREADRRFHLAQLRPNSSKATAVYCFVCNRTTRVRRVDCEHADCKSNVIADEGDHEDECLLDFHNQ